MPKSIKRFFGCLFASLLLILIMITNVSSGIFLPRGPANTQNFNQIHPGTAEYSFPLPDDCYDPTGLAWDGEHLWLCDFNGMIYKIHPADAWVVDSISSLGVTLTGLAWDEITHTLLGTEADSGSIYRIDPDTGVINRVFTATHLTNLQGIAHDGLGAIFYLDKAQQRIVKIDAATYEEIKAITTSSLNLQSLAWDGKYLWTVETDEDKILFIDPDKGLVVSSILSPASSPYGLACDRSETILWHFDRSARRIYKIIVRNTDVSFMRDSPYGAQIQYIDEVKNNGPYNLSPLKTFFAVPQPSPQQTFIMPIEYDSLHTYNDNLYDIYGQQVAYTKETLNVGSSTFPSYATEIINFNVRYFLYPEDLGDETFPQDITDLYITKTFPPESDKYDIDHPLIQAAAQEAITGAPNLYWKYRQINDYVVGHLYYKLDDTWDDAPVVLENGHGSCSEYTILFIALCRAAGLPARYQGGSRPRDEFPYIDDVFHRWAEVYFPNIGWVPVDPTWNDTQVSEPKIIAPYFGMLVNRVLVTTTGGGDSTGTDPEDGFSTIYYLKWNYNCYNSWTSGGSDVIIDRRCIWNAPSERRLVEMTIAPLNPIVRLERGVESLSVTGHYNDKTADDITEEVTWTSSDSQVGIVDYQGNFLAGETGITIITALHQDSGLTDSIEVVVVDDALTQRRLIITSSNGGTTDPLPGSYVYDPGTEVTLAATPDAHHRFKGWSGNVPQGHESSNPLTVVMDSHKSITANFIRQYTLTIASGTGGTTEPSPGSYVCDTGTEVVLEAKPDAQYKFNGWSGDVPSYQQSTNPLTVTLDSDKSIKANFQLKEDEPTENKNCFLETLTSGSKLESSLGTFRSFRDTFMMPSRFGRMTVRFYYAHSPFLVGLIEKYRLVKIIFFISLIPIVGFSSFILRLGPVVTAIVFASLILIVFFYYVRLFQLHIACRLRL